MRGLRDWTIFIDMDDVLVDFIGAFCRVHGVNRKEMDERRKTWYIYQAINPKLSVDQMWEPVVKLGKDFWINLEPLPWISELMNLLGKYKCSWYVLSAPCKHHMESFDGKRIWLENHFGKHFDRFLLTPHKYLVSKSKTLLIDDRPSNVQRFFYDESGTVKTGGQATIFPTTGMREVYGNKLDEWIPKPVEYLEEWFQSLERSIVDGQKLHQGKGYLS